MTTVSCLSLGFTAGYIPRLLADRAERKRIRAEIADVRKSIEALAPDSRRGFLGVRDRNP